MIINLSFMILHKGRILNIYIFIIIIIITFINERVYINSAYMENYKKES